MSEDTKDAQSITETAKPEMPQQQSIHAILKNLKRTDPKSRFVDLSSPGPMTVHSTGSSEDGPEKS